VRELLGNGSLLGYSIFGDAFQPWVVMVLPPGGFIVLGAWLLLFNWIKERSAKTTSEALVTQKEFSNAR
jgi:electron transport complex protein RnfE